MNLTKAQEIIEILKNALAGNEYWGDIYYLVQDLAQPENEREYEVYVEYHGEFILEKMSELLNLIGTVTYVTALQTKQIIIWG